MKFTEAFQALGYDVVSPRQDWSAESNDGICIALWAKEVDWKTLSADTRVLGGPIERWTNKPGNRKRIRHFQRAIAEFNGRMDVVMVHGEPGEGYGSASPWIASERRGHVWRVLAVDAETGHFQARTELLEG